MVFIFAGACDGQCQVDLNNGLRPYLIGLSIIMAVALGLIIRFLYKRYQQKTLGGTQPLMTRKQVKLLVIVAIFLATVGSLYAIYQYQYENFKQQRYRDEKVCRNNQGPVPPDDYSGNYYKVYDKYQAECDFRDRSFWPWQKDK